MIHDRLRTVSAIMGHPAGLRWQFLGGGVLVLLPAYVSIVFHGALEELEAAVVEAGTVCAKSVHLVVFKGMKVREDGEVLVEDAHRVHAGDGG